jgi:hypothetical protein
MTMRDRLVVPMSIALAVSCTTLAFTKAASADDEPNASDVAAARALGQEGVKLADAGNCADAIDRLARAEKMFHAPTTLARLGECQIITGKVVEGSENLNRVVRETLPANAPAPFVQAQERAKKVLADAKPKIAKLKIAVAAPADAQLSVKVDGEPVPVANLNTNRPMDPGEHLVEATAPGFKNASAKVKLSEGGVDSVALTLEPDPNAPKAATAGAAPATGSRGGAPADDGGRSKAPGYVVLAVGGVGLGVGVVTGLLALGKKSDLDSACGTAKVCTPAEQDTIDSGKTLATVSTIGFGAGIVGVAVGTYLLLTSGPSSNAPATATASRSTLTVRPVLDVSRVGLAGTF